MIDVAPEDLITSFLEQARKRSIAVVVFSAFDREGQFINRTNHNLNTGTEKAFLEPFLAVDRHTIEAAAKAVLRFSVPEADWDLLPEEHKKLFFKTAETVLLAARTAQATADLHSKSVLPPKPDPS